MQGVPTYPNLGNSTGPFSPRNPQGIGTSFQFAQVSEFGSLYPPDTMGDVGPTQILAITNGSVRVYSKSGTLGALNASLNGFFASVRGGVSTSDPHCVFDKLSSRWFVVAITVSSPNRILIATSAPVSGTVEITGLTSFTFFQFTQSAVAPAGDAGALADYPCIGIDANALYIACDMFTSSLTGSSGWVVRKSGLMAQPPTLTVTAFRAMGLATGGIGAPRGVVNDDPAATDGYFIGYDYAIRSRLVLRRVRNPGGVPTMDPAINIAVPTTATPSNIPVDAVDDRLFDARMFRNRATGVQTLWTAHCIRTNSLGVGLASGTRNSARWYEIQDISGTPSIRQSGTLYSTLSVNPVQFLMPTIAMNGQGHAAIGTTSVGGGEHLQVSVAGRLSTDPLGTTQPRTIAVTSNTNYSVGNSRWGDYSTTVVDPADDQTIWTFQEYCNATNSWACRAVKLLAPPPALPIVCDPIGLVPGVASALVVVTGDSTSGAGFYDTDPTSPSYVRHIMAAFSGADVTISNLAFNPTDPTRVTLTVSVSVSAAFGPRSLTITNPDGQSATGTGVFLVSPFCTEPIQIVSAPRSQEICPGGTPTLTIVVSGTDPHFQWRKHGVAILGANTPSLPLGPVGAADATDYDVIVYNLCGSATSAPASIILCSVDFNCTGGLNPQDIFDFLGAWFALDPRAEYNHDGHIDVGDIFSYLGAWFAGC